MLHHPLPPTFDLAVNESAAAEERKQSGENVAAINGILAHYCARIIFTAVFCLCSCADCTAISPISASEKGESYFAIARMFNNTVLFSFLCLFFY